MYRHRSRLIAVLATLAMLLPHLVLPATLAQEATPRAERDAGPVLLLAAPGLNLDLLTRFAEEGATPAIAALLTQGASAEGGLLAPFPASTGPGLTTLLTGTWPGEHGIVGDRFYRTGSPSFADFTTWDEPGIVQADTLPQAAERAGKQVAAIGWDGLEALDPPLHGPVISSPIALSRSGVLLTTALADQPARAEQAGAGYQRVDLQPAIGWSAAPPSFSPAQETTLAIASLAPAGENPDRAFPVYLYDSSDDATVNYDRVLIAPAKDAVASGVDLAAGAWGSLDVTLGGDLEGQSAGFWLKPIDLAPDLSQFRLYYTPISRVRASFVGCDERAECTATGGFTAAVAQALGAPMVLDPAPLDAGLIDDGTFADQATTASWQAVDALRLVFDEFGVKPDLLLLGATLPQTLSRQFLASLDDDPAREGYLREGYAAADQLLAAAQERLGPDAKTLLAAPTSLRPSTFTVDPGQVLLAAGLVETAQSDNCVPGPVTAPSGTPAPEALPAGPPVKACWDDTTAHIFINLDGREAAGSVAADDYEPLRDRIVAAFSDLTDAANPEKPVVAAVFRKEELRDIGGADGLHPSRSGDVVVALAPPYRFAATGEVTGRAAPLAVSGYLSSDDADPAAQGLFLAAGPAIAAGSSSPARAIDVAPTAAFLLDVPGPYNASGRILFALLRNGPALAEITLLDISDFHGQLSPLNATADTIAAAGAVNARYDVGGVAFLAPWFARFRADARGDALLVTAGDAVGATPPISNLFGDMPTIEMMNALGFTADSLGNHNFDAGAGYMFGGLASRADFPYLSANLVLAGNDTATPNAADAPFRPSLLLDVDGVSVGLIGFSNPDIPLLTRPGALDPYRVVNPGPAVNAEAERLRGAGAAAIIAIGHMGATGGDLTAPTGPVVAVANELRDVDLVVADHTDMQVSAVLPNRIMLVENRSKGVYFTRVRLVVDRERGEVIYRTADHHRPWTIGMTPDPDISAVIESLQADLAPMLGKVIGSATRPIPRVDSCGMETGRTCESLIGNVVTDAMRFTYGTDFALTNSGGIRADLTCPVEDGEFCPDATNGTTITEGQVLTVLPFGNVAVTLDISGAELKAMLESGVSRMPEASGGFPQVSGLCFTYDLGAEPGNRVTRVVRQATDGSCRGEPIDLGTGAMYTLATNDFTASGGDGYPVLLGRANTRDILAQVVASYIGGGSTLSLPGEPIAPAIQGRIVCNGEACPVPGGEQ